MADPLVERASILLVDDTPANLLALRAILDGLGLDIVEARSGEEALDRIAAQPFAAVLLDLGLPGLSGFETAQRIRAQARSRSTPILFLTAQDLDQPTVEAAYTLGAVAFLQK